MWTRPKTLRPYNQTHRCNNRGYGVFRGCIAHCKYLNARFECNDIVIFICSHYPLDPNAKSSDTKCFTLIIRWLCIRIEMVMTVHENYNVIAFKSCIQKFTVHPKQFFKINDRGCKGWNTAHIFRLLKTKSFGYKRKTNIGYF